jgi:hypothetical protein
MRNIILGHDHQPEVFFIQAVDDPGPETHSYS